jgi:DNA-binding protein HU-beta
MTKAELINAVHENIGGAMTKKDLGLAVQCVFDNLATAISSDDRFTYPGFGTFKVKSRGARMGRNPQTGEAIKIAASKTVSFKPAPSLKNSL